MDCPYIIRENIGFGRVREHGYYQLDEMAYDLTHDFAGADIEVITRPVYNLVMESGEELTQLDDDTVFKMLSAGLPIRYVENARDGYIMYSRPESKPAVKVKKSAVSLVQAQVVNSTMMQSLSPWQKSGRFLTVQTLATITALWSSKTTPSICLNRRPNVNGVIVRSMMKSACITMGCLCGFL